MSTTIDFRIKACFAELSQDCRWNVLTVLILHANIRNRCWPSVDTIARMATNGNKKIAIRARKWLEAHGALEVVPYTQRMTHDDPIQDETNLPQRKHVYQLTGVINLPDETGEVVSHTYLYINRNSVPGESSPQKSIPGESIPEHNQSKSIDSSNSKKQRKTNNKQHNSVVVETFDLLSQNEVEKWIQQHEPEFIETACKFALAMDNPPGWARWAMNNPDEARSFMDAKKQNGKKSANIEEDTEKFKRMVEKYELDKETNEDNHEIDEVLRDTEF